MELQTIAVIGAGRLGRRLAFLASRAGYSTVLEDVLPANLRKAEAGWAEFDGSQAGASGPAIRYASSLEDAVREADLIIDCVPDELESKLEIFSLLDRMAPPRSILATPTRSLSIADLASCTYRPERCIALELPDALLGTGALPSPCAVKLVTTRRTAASIAAAVAQFWRNMGLEAEVALDPLDVPDSAAPKAE